MLCTRARHLEFVGQALFDCSDQIEPFKCKMCPNFETNLLGSLRYHIRSGHQDEQSEEEIYKCTRCSLVTFSKYHSLFCEQSKVCHREDGATFSLKEEPIELFQENGEEIGPCQSGPSVDSGTKSSGKRRTESNHSNRRSLKGYRECLPEPMAFKCDQCPHTCRNKTSLKKHVERRHSKPEDIHWFKCDQCPSKFRSRREVRRHIKNSHTKPEDIQWFECAQCPTKFKEKGNLSKHVTTLHAKPEDVQWLNCDQCDSRFRRKSNLKNHIAARHSKPEDQQECDQCHSKFKNKASLKRHMRRHSDKPVVIQWVRCDKCDRTFKHKDYLRRHNKNLHS